MKTLYFDCGMGAAGDMLTAALAELSGAPEAFVRQFNAIGIPHVTMTVQEQKKCGIIGTRVHVLVDGEEEHEHHGHHHHVDMVSVEQVIASLNVSESVKQHALCVYRLIANAESHVHGEPIGQIHFHEVGTIDAIADVVGVCMLVEALAPDRVLASPVCVGSGQVQCAHGILPVPAPATAYLLQGVPMYGGTIKAELCTPTGAALLKHFVSRFCEMPTMAVSRIGYGLGSRDFEAANCVRAFLSDEEKTESVTELCCQVDDMTGEQIAFATEQWLAHGALDVYTTPIYMKKSRPGILFTVLCLENKKEEMLRLIFRHTTTLGVRVYEPARYTLSRKEISLSTPFGPVRGKEAEGFGTVKVKAEYEDAAAIARKENQPLSAVLKTECLDMKKHL